MVEEIQRKRLRVRLKAAEAEGLARRFANNLAEDTVFLKTKVTFAVGTPIALELCYSTGALALEGVGQVAWVRSGEISGVALQVTWSPESLERVRWVLARARELARVNTPRPAAPPPPDLEERFPEPETPVSLRVLDEPTPQQTRVPPLGELVAPAAPLVPASPDEIPMEPAVSAPRVDVLPESAAAEVLASLPIVHGSPLIHRPTGPTEYAGAAGQRDEVGIAEPPRERPEEWSDDGQPADWDSLSGEVTPLARIELVRQVGRGVDIEAGLFGDPRIKDAVKKKGAPLELGPKSRRVIGIDLGTTFTCAAVVEDGAPRVLPSRRGTPTIPSVVAIYPSGKTVIGEPALRRLPTNVPHTVVGGKRLIGRPFHSPLVQRVRRRHGYEIVAGDEGEASVSIGQHVISLEEISALILKEVRDGASLQLGERVNRAVITCPAFYNERQREAVRVAGELAGFHVERVLSEPTAAALTYGEGRQRRGKVFVYDLGGGTFDASLLDVDEKVYSVLATGGDTFLGGIDFDACLVSALLEDVRRASGQDARQDTVAMARLFEAAERAKRDLSEQRVAQVRVPFLSVLEGPPFNLEATIERERAEALFLPLIERTIEVCRQTCARAGVRPEEIDEVILVGGQSRTPLVREKVRALFGKDPRLEVHPDEAVAVGAALYAASMESFEGLVLVDSLPISVGTAGPGRSFVPLIRRGSALPARGRHLVVAADTELDLPLFQGEELDVLESELFGVVRLSGCVPGRELAIELEIGAEHKLSLAAFDRQSGELVPAALLSPGTAGALLERLGAELPQSPPRPEAPDSGLFSWLRRTLAPGRRRSPE